MDLDYTDAMGSFFDLLFEVHPRIDFRTPMDRLLAERRWCEAAAPTIESAAEFHRAANRFLTLVGDGHTVLRMPAATWVDAPVELSYVSGQVVVSASLGESREVEVGDRILEADHRDVMARLMEEMALTPSAQWSWGARRAVRTVLRRERDGAPEAVGVVLAKPDGRVLTTSLPLLPSDHPVFQRTALSRDRNLVREPFKAEWREDENAAILTYRVCQDRSDLAAAARRLHVNPGDIPVLATFLQGFFDEVSERGTTTLILDIRGNAGGDATLAMRALYPYLFSQSITTYGITTRVSERLRERAPWARDMPPGLVTVPPMTVSWPFSQVPGSGAAADPDHAQAHRFDGTVLVLIDGGTFSAGEWLAVDLYDNGRATFVGEPTGCGGSVPGEVVSFDLPQAGAEVDVCCRYFERSGPDKGAVKPLVYQPLLEQDFQARRDATLAAALAMAR